MPMTKCTTPLISVHPSSTGMLLQDTTHCDVLALAVLGKASVVLIISLQAHRPPCERTPGQVQHGRDACQYVKLTADANALS